jgi:hypothetical protein
MRLAATADRDAPATVLRIAHCDLEEEMSLAEHEPHRRNDLCDHDRNRHGNNRLPENARAQPLRAPVARGSFWAREIRWHSCPL